MKFLPFNPPFEGGNSREFYVQFPPAERSSLVSSTKGGGRENRGLVESKEGSNQVSPLDFSTSKCFYRGFKKVGEELFRLRNFEFLGEEGG